MRYTEKESFSEEKGLLQKILCAVTAPVRLSKELSTKFIFLKRTIIERMLLVSMVFALFGVAVELLFSRLSGTLNWFGGRFPFICKVVGLGVIALFYLFYELYEFSIYKQLNRLVKSHVIKCEEISDAGIAGELLSDAGGKNEELQLDLSILEKASTNTDDGYEDDTISINPSLLGDSVGMSADSIDLDDMLTNINFPENQLKSQNVDTQMGIPDEDALMLTEVTKPVFEEEEKAMPEKDTEKVQAIDIPNSDEVMSYQNQLQNCVNDLIASGLSYVGSLSLEDVSEIENEMEKANLIPEASVDPEIIEKGVNFEYDKDLEILDMQKSWKIPEPFKGLT